jgi:hypothetical protein
LSSITSGIHPPCVLPNITIDAHPAVTTAVNATRFPVSIVDMPRHTAATAANVSAYARLLNLISRMGHNRNAQNVGENPTAEISAIRPTDTPRDRNKIGSAVEMNP